MGRLLHSCGKKNSLRRDTAIQIYLLVLLLAIHTLLPVDLKTLDESDTDLQFADAPRPNWTLVTDGLPSTGEHYDVTFGDVNNDGKLDLAASTASGMMHIYVGDGEGNFAEESSGLPASGIAYELVFADFNNDGNLDLAGDERVYLGNGGEEGSMTWTYDSRPGSWFAATAADVNLDGKMDLIGGSGNGIHVWTGNGGAGGSITWTESSNGLPSIGTFWKPAIGDINHDGKPDLVCADSNNGIKAWTGNGLGGMGSFWTNAYTGTGLPETESYASVDLGDVNHDGNLDIVSTAYYSGNGVRVWLGNGGADGSIVWTENSNGLDTTSSGYLGVRLRDVNNDGNPDILAAHRFGNGLRLWLGDGGAGGTTDWTESSTGLPTGNYIAVDAGDYNNDGKIDIAAGRSPGVEIWQNDRPDFTIDTYVLASINLPVTHTWADVQFLDVNHDGKLDIGFTSFQGQNQGIRVYLGDGTGVWTESSSGLPTTGDFNGMRFADIDHNGTIDIIAAQNGGGGNNGIHAWSGDGTGSWTEMSLVSPNSGAGLELADLNHDGNLDVITGFWANNWGPLIFLGNGDFTWSANQGPPGEAIDVDDVAVADVNHDGHLDIAASSMNDVGIQLWTGDGTGMPGGWTRNDTGLPTTDVWLGLDFADVNHDGHPDLVGAGYAGVGGTGVHVWLGNGGEGESMLWTPADSGLPVTGRYGGVEFGDTNLDGSVDLVYASSEDTGATGIGYTRGNGGAGGSVIWSNPVISGIPTSGRHWGIAFGDMDNDGIPDIAATSDSGVKVYKQGSPPVFRPQISLSSPYGLQNWTGNSPQMIRWNLTDDSPYANLIIYLNYSYNAGASTGTIVGPISGTANPNSYVWTTPQIDATDVVINATVIDQDGLIGWDEVLVPDIDASPPGVALSVPGDSTTNVPVDQPLIIQFNESMQRSSVIPAISIAPNPDGWVWSWSSTDYSDDNLTGTHNPFDYGQTYSVSILQTALDASSPGNSLESTVTFSFTTGAANTLPAVSISSPTGGESWTGNTNHAISFIASDAEDATPSLQVWLNYSLTCDFPWSPIAGPIAGDSTPYAWLVPQVDTMTACVRAEVIDTDGGVGLAVSDAFEIDSSRPNVISTIPEDGAGNIPTNTGLQATWSETMNMSITNLSFSLRDNATWTQVSGQMNWTGTAFRFNPDFDLTTDSWYTANFTDLALDDSDPGNNLESLFSWSFRTALTADTRPPKIENLTASPSPLEVFSNINISADIFDDFDLLGAWIEFTPPSGNSTNYPLNSLGVRHYYVSSWNELGTYGYIISAVDSADNWKNETGAFQVVDLTPPTITDVTVVPDSVQVDGFVNISAVVEDNYDLSSVWILVRDPSNQETNVSMDEGTRYYLDQSYSDPGYYDFTIWASDSSDNWASSIGIFEIAGSTSGQGYVSISVPDEGDEIRTGINIIVEGWVVEFGAWRGISDVELVIALETMDGIRVGQEDHAISRSNGRFIAEFTIPDEAKSCNEYRLVVYSNDTNIIGDQVVLSVVDCYEDVIPIWILILIIMAVACVVVFCPVLIFIAKRKRKGEVSPIVVPISPETEEPEPEESDDVQA